MRPQFADASKSLARSGIGMNREKAGAANEGNVGEGVGIRYQVSGIRNRKLGFWL
jgi:hypothetical protein